MESLHNLILTVVVISCSIVVVFCGDHDHFDRQQKGGHRFHHAHNRNHRPGGLKLHLEEKGTAKNETVVIDVTRSQNDVDGSRSNLKVNLRVHIIKGNVHINGKKIDHAVVTAIHLRTKLDEIFADGRVERKRALVTVRVMVTEKVNSAGLKQLAVQEEITEIDGERVSQIEVKEIVLEMADKLNESKRTITLIKITESKIHQAEREHDKEIWACKGRLPNKPYHASKDEMRRMWKIHRSHKKPPHFEFGENDDRDVDDRDRQHGRRHHHRHRNFGRRFCKWFYKLPVGTRAVFCIAVIFFGVFVVASCCVCMCKKPKRDLSCPEKKHQLSEAGSEIDMEACPLPEKKSLDKQPLIA